MAKFEIDLKDGYGAVEKLETELRRKIIREMLQAGAKVLEKELKASIEARHHVITGAMRDSVAQAEVVEGLEESSIEVYPQAADARGVRNEMKQTIINKGFYSRGSGKRWKKDPYVKNTEKNIGPRIRAVMSQQMTISLKEMGIT